MKVTYRCCPHCTWNGPQPHNHPDRCTNRDCEGWRPQ